MPKWFWVTALVILLLPWLQGCDDAARYRHAAAYNRFNSIYHGCVYGRLEYAGTTTTQTDVVTFTCSELKGK